MTITLDAKQMAGRDAAHEYLSRQFAFPNHYGRNLDALYDLLSEISQTTTIIFEHTHVLDAYGTRILNTIRDAANHNPILTLTEKDC